MSPLAVVLLALAVGVPSEAANILAPVWFSGASHFAMFGRLFRELAARGHNVTVISQFPLKTPLKNYRDVSIASNEKKPELTWDLIERARSPPVSAIIMKYIARQQCTDALALPQLRHVLSSGDHYDLVITEFFHADCMAAFAAKFGVPLVGITSSMALPRVYDRIGNPYNPAYMEQYDLHLKAPFSFWGRVQSTLVHLLIRAADWWITEAFLEEKVRAVLGGDTPQLRDVLRNTSLVLVNSHWSWDQPLPAVPALVQVGGLHVEEPRALPQDLRSYIDKSRHGVIYFSLGSMVKTSSLPAEKLRSIIDAFAAVPQNVLWRVDPSSLPPLPPNVRAETWMPQNDILNHPNLHILITHGGLMGIQEAVMAGVPVLAVPLFADQYLNAERVAASGSGICLHFEDLTTQTLRAALDALVNDTRYREQAKHLSLLFRDRPRPPLEEAVYWVEYVLRHQGARHLRSAALDLTWYQLLLLDVATFLVAVALTLCLIFCQLTSCLKRNFSQKQKVKIN
ncbi:UDP-glycosyltransferase UGT5-like [Schistocerca piceifrons]|uniref:UDP-glycosyltransferase UGT5-like n=1 Tax=Schistocerca piceifrons TaxID=274613 RepID=UPI001F5F321E|nr:UDP-glycosyltransferase UGT5-like [Schistocerca piceifrons]